MPPLKSWPDQADGTLHINYNNIIGHYFHILVKIQRF